mmetsp:Transcript_94348/g.177574  ORF Transcript_94348/g.177574 Transcript_94348/m.177574 type:complete len:508 (-) Transcript_94348:358-1881(-)
MIASASGDDCNEVRPEDASENVEVKVTAASSGELLGQWQLPCTATVHDLQKYIHATLEDPTLLVTLLQGARVLVDKDAMGMLSEDDGTIVLNCVKQRSDFAEEPDPRLHFNVAFLGHVDAGKATICGRILYEAGCGEDGKVHFATSNRRFTFPVGFNRFGGGWDMIAGASHVDIGVLMISARKGEFETGFEGCGQTKEHAYLAKGLGAQKLLVCVNKMDDFSVGWSQTRFEEIVQKVSLFLHENGFKEDEVCFLPTSGLTGDNVKDRMATPSWFVGDTLLDMLDSMEVSQCSEYAPLRIPMYVGYSIEDTVFAVGKVEQGIVRPGMKCTVMPKGQQCFVQTVYINDRPMRFATTGENVTLKMMGCGEDQLVKGFVLCDQPCSARAVSKFKAILQIVDMSNARLVLSAGYRAVMHIHGASEDCEILKLYEIFSTKDKTSKQQKPAFARASSTVLVSIQLARPTTVDVFTACSRLGCFALCDEGRMVGTGKITELPREKHHPLQPSLPN